MNVFASLLLVAYNYCTLSYTMAFWSKAEWEPELDRLQRHGFNVALVTAGLPKVWELTLKELGYDEESIKAFIPDEAAAAWWNMGNLEGLGGPVPPERIERDAELGRWLCAEMRKRGIEPILQGFTGLVPACTEGAIAQGHWCYIYERPAILDPASERFDEFARVWYGNLEKVYGIKPKYLGGDLFHEGGIADAFEPGAITEAARKVQRLQQEAFPGVTWVLQSWQDSPRPEIRAGLDPRFTLIEVLDKDMSNLGEYDYRFGELPWVWCEVMNFGGNTGLYGGVKRFENLDKIANGKGKESFRGFGMLSEGLETNDFCYYVFFKSVAGEKASIADYVRERYGVEDPRLEQALGIIARTAWDCRRKQEGCVENVMCAVPAWEVRNVSAWGPRTGTPYNRRALVRAAELYLASYREGENFRNDMTEIFMQLLADKARELLPETQGDRAKQLEFLRLIAMADKLAGFSDNWRLDRKLDRTRTQAGRDGAKGYLRMITTWAEGEAAGEASGLRDYAHRAYHGLLSAYYLARWEKFFGVRLEREGELPDDLRELAATILEAVR